MIFVFHGTLTSDGIFSLVQGRKASHVISEIQSGTDTVLVMTWGAAAATKKSRVKKLREKGRLFGMNHNLQLCEIQGGK